MPREPSKIMRQNPVPPGRYWLGVPQAKFKIWDDLVERNKGALQIDHHESSHAIDDPTRDLEDWFIFFVTAPLSWPLGKLAQPNTAPDWVQRQSDVYGRPDDARRHPIDTSVEMIEEEAREAAAKAKQLALSGWEELKTLLVIGGLAWLLLSRR